jgi:hypothetical protein
MRMKAIYILLIAIVFASFNFSVEANIADNRFETEYPQSYENKFADRFSEYNSIAFRSSTNTNKNERNIDLGGEPNQNDALDPAPVGDATEFVVVTGLVYALLLYRRKKYERNTGQTIYFKTAIYS